LQDHLIIAGNISYALGLDGSNFKSVYFLRNDLSSLQSDYSKSVFALIQKIYPSARIIESLDPIRSSESIYYSGNLAYAESKELSRFANIKFAPQNRLFDQVEKKYIKSFTPFRKKYENYLPERFDTSCQSFIDQEVLEHLDWYFYQKHLAKTYFDDRNGILGKEYSTKLSKYLSDGRLDVKFLYNYIKNYEAKHGANKSTYWIVFELLWREFFFWSYHFHQTKYFSKNGLTGPLDFSSFRKDRDFSTLFANDPLMLSIYNELVHSGFVSNRYRQVFASNLINKYQLDWREGAYLFERFLIDYDVFSNYGNWQYLAGVGHDPRVKRVFDTLKQVATYDPDYLYIKHWSDYQDSNEISEKLSSIYKQF
tara:strand:- start:2496 stop:3596 length:1101 start_codon:yes stop_codon:yes gene_type:complete